MATVKEIVQNALADKIDEVRTDFGTEMSGRLADRMGARKQEIAKSYFGQAVAECVVTENDLDADLSEDEIWIEEETVAEARKRGSPNYLFTHKPGDAESEAKLADAKKKGRVALQGRLGKNSPHADHYKNKKMWHGGSQGKYQRIKKAHASHFDVYRKD